MWTTQRSRGDVEFIDGTVDLNGHTLRVGGNLLHSGGDLLLNGGTLEIVGNFVIAGSENENAAGRRSIIAMVPAYCTCNTLRTPSGWGEIL